MSVSICRMGHQAEKEAVGMGRLWNQASGLNFMEKQLGGVMERRSDLIKTVCW